MPTIPGGTGASEWTVGSLLTRGKLLAAAMGAAGGQQVIDVDCAGDSELTVQADMTGAANGDLAVTVLPFEDDNVTLSPVGLPVIRSVGPTFNVNRVYFEGTYDVSGVSKVRVVAQNNNVAGQTLTRMSWRLS